MCNQVKWADFVTRLFNEETWLRQSSQQEGQRRDKVSEKHADKVWEWLVTAQWATLAAQHA